MSLGAEIYAETLCAEVETRNKIAKGICNKKWYSGNKEIAISEMSDRYINNCIKWIEQCKTDEFNGYLDLFEEELKKRKDHKK